MVNHSWNLFRVTLLPALVLLGLSTACERQATPPAPESQPAAVTAFTPPDVSTYKLPPKLQERVRGLLKTIQDKPQAPEPLGALGSICFVQNDFAGALRCFTRTRELAPGVMHWWYYEGLSADGAGRKEAAIKAYEHALELDATYMPVYVRLAALLIDADRERAEKLCRRAIEMNPRDASAACTLGHCLEAGGDSAGARKQYEEALKLAPAYRDAHEGMARLCAAAGQNEEAARHKEQAARGTMPVGDDQLFGLLFRQGFHLEALLRYALGVAERGMFGESDKILEMAGEADAEGAATHQAAGYIRALEGRFEEAAAEYRAALEIKPELVELRGRLADVLARQEKYTEAEAEFRKVLEKEPDDAFTLEFFSRLLLVLKRTDEAEKLLRDAVARKPEEAWLYLQLGTALSFAGKDNDAFEAFSKCLQLAPESAAAFYNLGLIEQRRGDVAKATENWKKAIELEPKYRDAHIQLAGTAIQAKDYKTAEQYLRSALTQDPDFPGFNNSLAWLLATSPDDAQRNGEEATRLAEKACRLTEHKQHGYMDTLAAAYAENGRFDEAATTEQGAIDLAQKEDSATAVEAYQKRLALYQEKKPYREAKQRR